ncbi:hypothetical protein OK016_00400 [Vibrio chagasii]|nr:hypothetical protein [Vibrio chagasii]
MYLNYLALAEEALKLVEQTINSTILANASEFSEEGNSTLMLRPQ